MRGNWEAVQESLQQQGAAWEAAAGKGPEGAVAASQQGAWTRADAPAGAAEDAWWPNNCAGGGAGGSAFDGAGSAAGPALEPAAAPGGGGANWQDLVAKARASFSAVTTSAGRGGESGSSSTASGSPDPTRSQSPGALHAMPEAQQDFLPPHVITPADSGSAGRAGWQLQGEQHAMAAPSLPPPPALAPLPPSLPSAVPTTPLTPLLPSAAAPAAYAADPTFADGYEAGVAAAMAQLGLAPGSIATPAAVPARGPGGVDWGAVLGGDVGAQEAFAAGAAPARYMQPAAGGGAGYYAAPVQQAPAEPPEEDLDLRTQCWPCLAAAGRREYRAEYAFVSL